MCYVDKIVKHDQMSGNSLTKQSITNNYNEIMMLNCAVILENGMISNSVRWSSCKILQNQCNRSSKLLCKKKIHEIHVAKWKITVW